MLMLCMLTLILAIISAAILLSFIMNWFATRQYNGGGAMCLYGAMNESLGIRNEVEGSVMSPSVSSEKIKIVKHGRNIEGIIQECSTAGVIAMKIWYHCFAISHWWAIESHCRGNEIRIIFVFQVLPCISTFNITWLIVVISFNLFVNVLTVCKNWCWLMLIFLSYIMNWFATSYYNGGEAMCLHGTINDALGISNNAENSAKGRSALHELRRCGLKLKIMCIA